MRWSNVSVIFRREVKDQLRDRRTLFMILVLPILLYPILGIGISFMVLAFEREVRTVVVVGAEYLPEHPPLLNEEGTGFLDSLFEAAGDIELLQVRTEPDEAPWNDPLVQLANLRGPVDAFVIIPPDIREQIEAIGRPEISIRYDRADEPSQTTYLRVREVLGNWRDAILAQRLAADEKPAEYTEPIEIRGVDLAGRLASRPSGGSVWAKLFPFLLVMMALTGAFYPAVDLCAGEKERGTMETLLISPAGRGEIVLGKFLTVCLASIATALLNLASMGLTMSVVTGYISPGGALGGSDLADLEPPAFSAIFWMVLLLIPLAIFFSAVCVALAVMARSMKEGQYYMTPLYLLALPLIFLTLVPGIQLTPLYSLIPITGVALLLKELMLGHYAEAQRYFATVLLTTIAYGAIALRWAVHQFQDESVLFRESERFDLVSYTRHLIRDRGPLPSSGGAVALFALFVMLSFYSSRFLVQADPMALMVIGQLGFILLPTLAMTFLLTSSPKRTLRLRRPSGRHLALGAALAITLNPLVFQLRPVVEYFFPTPPAIEAALEQMMSIIPNLPTAILLFALIPAICEELAFRGYILSGLQTGHRTWTAIVLSAFLFGFLHVIMSLSVQQLPNAILLGIVLGLLAIKSRSLVPGVVFHFINNAIVVVLGTVLAGESGRRAIGWLFQDPAQGLYHWYWLVPSALASVAMLWLLFREPWPVEQKEPSPTPADRRLEEVEVS
ncbi:ABC transporter permease subunit [soil metagenome]